MRSSRTSRTTSRALTGSWGTLQKQRTTTSQADSHRRWTWNPIKELFEKFSQGASGTDQSHAGQVRRSGGLRIEPGFWHLLRNLKESLAPKFGRTGERAAGAYPPPHALTSGQARCFLFWSAWVSCAAFPSGATSSLWKSKRQYADDALKFRVIRSWGRLQRQAYPLV